MGHPNRCHEPDVWQHLMIRGVSRRTIFDRDADARAFVDRMDRSVDRGDLRVMAFCLMPNHVHLIVRSPRDRLGDAMRDVEGPYVRGFNRSRGRLGHLVQGRYLAKAIRTQRYLTAAIAYLDQNPVEAGLVLRPEDYPLGSARHYARQVGPLWLDRSWVEAYLAAGRDNVPYSPTDYALVFGTRTSASARRWFASAMESHRPDDLTLDALIRASPAHIVRWMEEQSQSADGTGRVVPFVDGETIAEAVAALSADDRERRLGLGGRARPVARVLATGLLRCLAGLTYEEIALRTGQSDAAGRLTARAHEAALRGDPWYRELVGRVSRSVLDACHPPASPRELRSRV